MKKGVSLARYTTLKIGGPADYFISVKNDAELQEAIRRARAEKIPWLVIGSGSNLLVSDRGFRGLTIRNRISGIEKSGRRLLVKGGTPLPELVNFANRSGLKGFEKMVGIPGTVGGAVCGNAGAYGQTISDHLTRVTIFDGRRKKALLSTQCLFSYRESVFKERKDWIILEVRFQLEPGDPEDLRVISQEIRAVRESKYPLGMKCPGSFFKNIGAERLPKNILKKIPPDKIVYGKIPAGYLLEEVGANGQRKGDIFIANYHGNLFVNGGRGTARDLFNLAQKFQRRVKEKFGITLEPEVQLVGFKQS